MLALPGQMFPFQLATMTAMDIWLLSCMGFVSLALLEYAALLWIKYDRGDEKNKIKCATKKEVDKRCRRLDKLALVLFIVANALFNLCYWIYFLTN
jgi:hypothetical protein